MPPQKKPTNKPEFIDHTAVTTAALKGVKTARDYHRLSKATEAVIFQAAWDNLDPANQQRICQIVDNNIKPNPKAIASELTACGALTQLQAIKAEYGEALVKQAWMLLPADEKARIKAICEQPEPQPEVTDVTKEDRVAIGFDPLPPVPATFRKWKRRGTS